MNKREAYEAGYDRGWNVASWTEMPTIGSTLALHVDWVGIGTIETVEEQLEAWELMCSEAEREGRQFSPFEFLAQDLNQSRDPDAYWDAFEEGVAAGICAYRRKHHKLTELRREARQAA